MPVFLLVGMTCTSWHENCTLHGSRNLELNQLTLLILLLKSHRKLQMSAVYVQLPFHPKPVGIG